MATRLPQWLQGYEAGFKRHFGGRFANLSEKTTEGEIQQIYDDWAKNYDKVISSFIIPPLRHFTILGQKNAQNMPRYYTVEQGKNTD